MRIQRVMLAGIAAGVLVVAAGCKSTTTTTTSTTPGSMASSSTITDEGTTYTTTTPASTTVSTTSSSAALDTTSNGAIVTNPAPGTTVVDNGSTRTVTTTTVNTAPNGTTTVSTTPATSMTSSSSLDTTNNGSTTYTANGAQVTTRTVTTTTSTKEAAPAVASASVTTVPCATTTSYPAMTSSSQTIYTPAPMYRNGRSGRGLDLLVFADRASFSNSNTNVTGGFDMGTVRSDIRHENGYGIGLNAYWTPNFSTEFTASRVRPTATFTPSNTAFNPITGLRLKMTPITGTLQLHFAPHKGIDPYIGAGAAYVMFDTAPGSAFNSGNTGITNVDFRNEWGPLANAGLNFGLSHGFGINIDAKYMWVRARATTTFDNSVTIGNVGNSSRFGLNPFLLSAGLRFGF